MNNKVIVITGGGGVLGAEMAKDLGKNNKVAILDLNVTVAQKVAKEINDNGGTAIGVECNVLKKDSIENAKKIVNEKFGIVDILINGAGGNHKDGTTSHEFFHENKEGDISFFDLKAEGISFVFDLNFLGTFLPSQVFGTDLVKNKDACILNISSMNAFTPLTKIPAYSGAKSAISNFTEWLAVYFAKSNIRVNAIAPGFFVTNQNYDLLYKEENVLSARGEKIISQTPMGEFGKPEDLLGSVNFLIDSDKSRFITGIVLPVDGGFSSYSGV